MSIISSHLFSSQHLPLSDIVFVHLLPFLFFVSNHPNRGSVKARPCSPPCPLSSEQCLSYNRSLLKGTKQMELMRMDLKAIGGGVKCTGLGDGLDLENDRKRGIEQNS